MFKQPFPSMDKIYDAYRCARDGDSGYGASFIDGLSVVMSSEWMERFQKHKEFRDTAYPFTIWDNSANAWSVFWDTKQERERIKPVERLYHSWTIKQAFPTP